MKVDLKINYLELENIAENVGKYKKAIEDINDAIENLDKVIQKQKSKSTKKLESKISNKKTKRSDLIDELDDIQKIIKDYCEDMRNLVNCKSEGTITRVDQFDIQFNIWQIAGDLTTFIGQMTEAPVEPPTPISVGPSNENNQRKMKANYNKLLSFHRSHIVPTYRLVDDYIDRLHKIYDKNIAPYENLDDDYESKMASIYHRGKSWTQIAEDWLFDHKGEIVAFCKSFAIAFLTTCTLIVIATAISVSAPVVFTVFGILVAAGQCTISCMPKSAFEAEWLKGIKDSSDSYVDGLREKWKALSDRGIYGVLECIGQDIGDASQTGKGLATITGSITGMIAGSFAGDNLSLKVKKVKAAKAKAKSLKISETKEPELKNVEVEKVGKTEAKFKKSKTKFSSENGDINSIFKNGKVIINDLKANPSVFRGKSVNEIAQVLKENGYDVTVKVSTRSRSRAQIIKINNPGNGKNISQVQVSPGGGRHGSSSYVKISTTDQGIIKIVDGLESNYKTDGKETSTIIFSGGN